MKALISTNEPVAFDENGVVTGYRVADAHETGFDVHESLFWVDCPDDVTNDSQFYYDVIEKTVKPFPQPDPNQPQPISEGTQEL
jgi:hypothetical protein